MKKLRVYLLIAVLIVACIVTATPVSYARAETRRAYVGGFPIGISIDVGGLLVESVTGVETEYGTAYVDGIKKGDIITAIGETPMRSVDDVSGALEPGRTRVEIIRNGERLTAEITPLIEKYSGAPRLGVRIKDRIYGIGTVSMIREDGRYAALGHEIYDENGAHIPFCSGKIHGCKLFGVKKGENGEAGALLGTINIECERGTVTCNNGFGIAGDFSGEHGCELMEIASRDEVVPGAAKIRTTVDDAPEYFDIEIIKASRRAGRREKSIVFRVTDKRLLEKTGGVVRGMSGSPIIQNGKLVGAVTHVFLNDFTKGYGVYADCLN